ncbi:hypothetical protein GB864_13300, partial [Agromyces sp. MMS17-SY077]|nr:hypothetical protein [Agromyces seonyuensis]
PVPPPFVGGPAPAPAVQPVAPPPAPAVPSTPQPVTDYRSTGSWGGGDDARRGRRSADGPFEPDAAAREAAQRAESERADADLRARFEAAQRAEAVREAAAREAAEREARETAAREAAAREAAAREAAAREAAAREAAAREAAAREAAAREAAAREAAAREAAAREAAAREAAAREAEAREAAAREIAARREEAERVAREEFEAMQRAQREEAERVAREEFEAQLRAQREEAERVAREEFEAIQRARREEAELAAFAEFEALQRAEAERLAAAAPAPEPARSLGMPGDDELWAAFADTGAETDDDDAEDEWVQTADGQWIRQPAETWAAEPAAAGWAEQSGDSWADQADGWVQTADGEWVQQAATGWEPEYAEEAAPAAAWVEQPAAGGWSLADDDAEDEWVQTADGEWVQRPASRDSEQVAPAAAWVEQPAAGGWSLADDDVEDEWVQTADGEWVQRPAAAAVEDEWADSEDGADDGVEWVQTADGQWVPALEAEHDEGAGLPEELEATAAEGDELWNLFGGREQDEIDPPVRRRSFEEPAEPLEATRALPAVGAANGWSLADEVEGPEAEHAPGDEAFFDWGLRADPTAADPRADDAEADPWWDPFGRDQIEQQRLGSFTEAISVLPDDLDDRPVLDRLPNRGRDPFDDGYDADRYRQFDEDENPFAALFAPTGPVPILAGAGSPAAQHDGFGQDPFASLSDDGYGPLRVEPPAREPRGGQDPFAGARGTSGRDDRSADRYASAGRTGSDRAGSDRHGSDRSGSDRRELVGAGAGGRGGSGGSGRGPGDEGGASVVQVLVWVAVGLVALLILLVVWWFGFRQTGTDDTAAGPTETSEAADPAPTAAQAPGGTYRWDALFGGECLDPFTSAWDTEFAVVDCAAPHAAQLVYRGTIVAEEGAAFPGEEALMQQAGTGCAADGVIDVNAAAGIPDLQMQSTYPVTADQWDSGVRNFYCFVSRSGGEALTASLAGPGPAA